eukprot:10177251-Ditylum_brightwellii.AAC.1
MCNKDVEPRALSNIMKSMSAKINALGDTSRLAISSHCVGIVNGMNNHEKAKQYKFGLYMRCPIICSSNCTGKSKLSPVGK